MKPAPSVPQTTALLEQAIAEANLSDYLQVAWIHHEHVEQAIALSDAVAFTGSTQTGRHIASLAGKHLKKRVRTGWQQSIDRAGRCRLNLGGTRGLSFTIP